MKGFINILLIIGVAVVSIIGTAFFINYVKQQVDLGATVLTTNLSDIINTFRTNVNTSLDNLNASLSNSTSSDPGHTHTIISQGSINGSSTLQIGNNISGVGPGCLILGNSAGVTSTPVYITATGTTLSATTTKPSICK